MRYIRPENVLSPRDFVSNVERIFDGGEDSFSIARLLWEGDEVYAMRWNVARREQDNPNKIAELVNCVGMPSSHGYPVWFIIPKEFIQNVPELLTYFLTLGQTQQENRNE